MTFTSEGVDDDAISEILRATPMKVTAMMNDDLNLPYSDDEIRAALFQMHPSKSPGPGGISPFFYQKYWHIVGFDVCTAIQAAHFMHKLRSQEKGFFSLKLDISKAYDRLELPFLHSMLVKLGFSSKWINMVMSCVTSVSYSILVQGEPSEHIYPTRGIRQGDPLSPYLFILCDEGLSALISQAMDSGAIHGLKMCPQAPIPHHLFFADDSLLFGAATVAECITHRQILNTYERAFGQKVNFQKNSVVFSRNIHIDVQNELATILEVECVEDHDRYLGLPMQVGKSKTQIFQYIKEKLSNKLDNWKAKILSCAEKEILIKTVAQMMPLYAMNCYLLPKTLCDDVHKLCASFFWGDTNDKRKIHWRSWERLCLTKHEGGMGFKNIYAYNLAMLAKQGWRLVTNPNSLIARLYKTRYFPHCEFWLAELGEAPSFSWHSILADRLVLKARTKWRIGDDLIDSHTRQWIADVIHTNFHPNVAVKVLCIPLSSQPASDMLYWHLERRGSFTVKSAYWIACSQVLQNVLVSTSNGDPYKELWRKLWKAQVPGKVLICAWRACCNLLPTRERLSTKGYEGELRCLLCNYLIEDTAHLFCKCPLAQSLLSQPPLQLQNSLLPQIHFKEWMLEHALKLKMEDFEKLLMLIWGLWTNQNSKLWEDTSGSAIDIMFKCFSWLDEF
ncbi:uncharacterized protein LOC112184337 [Rosa chinensis]|uniref:uncharacterized protein LOC112184337 n=1 Tax=Rosa chinensis TaxID=74649 RepID=UPI000D0870DC|nr:uncharacterized protein LOC112184337 [Rosa chinensis]